VTRGSRASTASASSASAPSSSSATSARRSAWCARRLREALSVRGAVHRASKRLWQALELLEVVDVRAFDVGCCGDETANLVARRNEVIASFHDDVDGATGVRPNRADHEGFVPELCAHVDRRALLEGFTRVRIELQVDVAQEAHEPWHVVEAHENREHE